MEAMRSAFKNLFWYCFLPGLLIFLLYPVQVNGYLNPHDEGIWLGTLQMLWGGGRLYRDIFFHYGPVLPLTLCLALRMAPMTLASVRVAIWLLNAAGLLCVYLCLLKFARAASVRIPLSIFMFMVPLAAHVLTIPIAARYGAGFASLLFWPLGGERESGNTRTAALFSGLLAALAVSVSQEVGLAAFAAGACFFYLKFDTRSELKYYFASFTGALAIFLLAVSARYGLKDYLTDAGMGAARLVFLEKTRFPSLRWAAFNAAGGGAFWKSIPGRDVAVVLAAYLPACTYAAVFVRGWRTRPPRQDHAASTSLAVYGVLSAVAGWSRSDTWHIYFALSPAFLLWAYEADEALHTMKKAKQVWVLGLCVVGALLTLPHYLARQKNQRWLDTVQRPVRIERAGSSRLPYPQANGYEFLVDWIHARTKRGEPIFFFPYDGSIYFLADRPNPCFLPVLALGITKPMQERAVRELQASKVHWAIWDTENTAFDGVPIKKFLPVVYAYLRGNYRVVEKKGPFLFLERLPAPV